MQKRHSTSVPLSSIPSIHALRPSCASQPPKVRPAEHHAAAPSSTTKQQSPRFVSHGQQSPTGASDAGFPAPCRGDGDGDGDGVRDRDRDRRSARWRRADDREIVVGGTRPAASPAPRGTRPALLKAADRDSSTPLPHACIPSPASSTHARGTGGHHARCRRTTRCTMPTRTPRGIKARWRLSLPARVPRCMIAAVQNAMTVRMQ